MGNTPKGNTICAFCLKSQHEVKKLIAGPGASICDECVGKYGGMMADGADGERRTRPKSTDDLAEAFDFANRLHHKQRRKGSDIPFITHLMAVSALVGEYGGSVEQMIAALLHDAVEDQGGAETLEEIRCAFGDRVAELVHCCSEIHDRPKPPWESRKKEFLQRLPSTPPEAKLIIAADKLHNVRSMCRDYLQIGEDLWGRFHGGRDGTFWYIQECQRLLCQGWDHPILEELKEVEEALREAAGMETEPPRRPGS